MESQRNWSPYDGVLPIDRSRTTTNLLARSMAVNQWRLNLQDFAGEDGRAVLRQLEESEHECTQLLTRTKYQYTGKLGSGSFGSVFRGSHVERDTEYAVKILKPKRTNHPLGQRASEILKERDLLIYLKCANVVPLVAAFYDKAPFIVTELCRGNYRQLGSRINTTGHVRAVVHILRGLEYIHKMGVIHADIKPENILFTRDENFVLADFGSSIILKQHQKTAISQKLLTSLGYGDIEIHEEGSYSKLSDIFAAGCTLFEGISSHTLMMYGQGSEYHNAAEYCQVAKLGRLDNNNERMALNLRIDKNLHGERKGFGGLIKRMISVRAHRPTASKLLDIFSDEMESLFGHTYDSVDIHDSQQEVGYQMISNFDTPKFNVQPDDLMREEKIFGPNFYYDALEVHGPRFGLPHPSICGFLYYLRKNGQDRDWLNSVADMNREGVDRLEIPFIKDFYNMGHRQDPVIRTLGTQTDKATTIYQEVHAVTFAPVNAHLPPLPPPPQVPYQAPQTSSEQAAAVSTTLVVNEREKRPKSSTASAKQHQPCKAIPPPLASHQRVESSEDNEQEQRHIIMEDDNGNDGDDDNNNVHDDDDDDVDDADRFPNGQRTPPEIVQVNSEDDVIAIDTTDETSSHEEDEKRRNNNDEEDDNEEGTTIVPETQADQQDNSESFRRPRTPSNDPGTTTNIPSPARHSSTTSFSSSSSKSKPNNDGIKVPSHHDTHHDEAPRKSSKSRQGDGKGHATSAVAAASSDKVTKKFKAPSSTTMTTALVVLKKIATADAPTVTAPVKRPKSFVADVTTVPIYTKPRQSAAVPKAKTNTKTPAIGSGDLLGGKEFFKACLLDTPPLTKKKETTVAPSTSTSGNNNSSSSSKKQQSHASKQKLSEEDQAKVRGRSLGNQALQSANKSSKPHGKSARAEKEQQQPHEPSTSSKRDKSREESKKQQQQQHHDNERRDANRKDHRRDSDKRDQRSSEQSTSSKQSSAKKRPASSPLPDNNAKRPKPWKCKGCSLTDYNLDFIQDHWKNHCTNPLNYPRN